MDNIKLLRIDNRLVHGQVGIFWTSSVNANIIVVVDDEASNDVLQQQLMQMTADSAHIDIRFFSIQKTVDTIHKASDSQKIFMVCKTPSVVRKLIEEGVAIKKVNVGNMHFSNGKQQISAKVFVDDNDKKDLIFIRDHVAEISIQDTPSDTKKDLNF